LAGGGVLWRGRGVVAVEGAQGERRVRRLEAERGGARVALPRQRLDGEDDVRQDVLVPALRPGRRELRVDVAGREREPHAADMEGECSLEGLVEGLSRRVARDLLLDVDAVRAGVERRLEELVEDDPAGQLGAPVAGGPGFRRAR